MLSAMILAAAVSGSAPSPACSWDNPGHDPYMGDVTQAVDHYKDIPPLVRAELKVKMAKRTYDDLADIKRDKIAGKSQYTNLRDMHFGSKGQICTTVSRAKWTSEMGERGLVYCAQGYCILVPTVCRNVSRIDKTEPPAGGGGGPGGPPVSGPPIVVTEVPPSGGPGMPPNELMPPAEIPPIVTLVPPSELPPSVVPPTVNWPPLFPPEIPPGFSGPPIVIVTQPPPCCCDETSPPVVPPTTPVPEPNTLMYALAGSILGACRWFFMRFKNRST